MTMPVVVAATPLDGHRLRVQFDDGLEGVVDVARLVTFRGVLEPLADPGYFARGRVDADAGTVVWPNGVDLDPPALYAAAKGVPVADLLTAEDALAG